MGNLDLRQQWKYSWQDLAKEVVPTGLCTGCSGCIISCPHQVLNLNRHVWKPELAQDAWVNADERRCSYGERGCTVCARVCPRFRLWEADADEAKWSRHRTAEEVLGVYRAIVLVQAKDSEIADAGQDGGLGTALLLYALENDYIDAALVSFFDEEMRTRPGIARTRDELLACAGSRYTYSANVLGIDDANEVGAQRLGLVSVGCQTSIPPVAYGRGARKLAKRFALVVGLLCSKTFTDDIYEDLLEAKYGIARHLVTKINIKGRLQVWHEDAGTGAPKYVEIPLKECNEYTRPGCMHCPDFSAQHADISLGGIGKGADTTLAIVRSELGEEILAKMEQDGLVTVTDATEDDPDAIALILKMARRQRKRWPVEIGSIPVTPEETST
ncbi:coenzyme F420-reducing hydrogenase subunit beta [bacterium BMS3Abin02]|nr:coenzyme F420-reducing hydrogenase subunit beta [bacterium BMS3Abin02]GBE22023.1 coenzyme F420-reducing hydrogenase subunit beta [bacterium BMS3Bbin01]